ncbi:MAG: restriction endonuclease subunit S [Nitrospira sp.]|nr:restriction endonuclease subunit S [Nitrospira sp.]
MSKRLRDVAEVHYGKSPNEVLTEDSPIPIVGTGGIYGHASRAMYNGPAVVVPRKGSLGNPQYVNEPFWPVDTTYVVIPKAGVDAKWLYYSLDAFDLTKLNEQPVSPVLAAIGCTKFWLAQKSMESSAASPKSFRQWTRRLSRRKR